MNCLKFEKDKRIEDNIIMDVRNLFRLNKEIDDNIIKNIRNLFNYKMKMNQSKTE